MIYAMFILRENTKVSIDFAATGHNLGKIMFKKTIRQFKLN
jgi:hypothetical protein